MSKRLFSIILVAAMLLTLIILPTTLAEAKTDEVAETSGNSTAYGLATKVQDGNILQAFNWKASEITEHAKDIAEAGYSTVQITPMQKTKITKNCGSYATDWWCYYQPTGMEVGNTLGTQSEIKTMCSTLHSYGIKVIADVVTNHSMGIKAKLKKESDEVKKQLDSNFIKYCRREPNINGHQPAANDNNREQQVQEDLDAELPDINTSNKNYQNLVINNLLNVYLNLGVDGFRFDAAKHIETPKDGQYASDYWPTVTKAIKNKKSDAYIYGEVLASNGKFNITDYTEYIHVTDYAYGETVRKALNNSSASSLVNYGYSGSQKSDNVLWVESHDNFISQESTNLSTKKQVVGWAAIAARKDAPALYFPRPTKESLDSKGYIKYDEYMGYTGTKDTWKSKEVAEVNKFKNAFVGQNETVSADGSVLYVQRGTSGMVISNLAASSKSISKSCTMANGTYTDQVSGNKFTVSGGKITGNVGASGVAVIYNKTNVTPKITVKLGTLTLTSDTNNRYTDAQTTVSVSATNATKLSIKVSNLTEKSFNGNSTSFKLNNSIAYGKSVDISVTATSSEGVSITDTYRVHKKNANETKVVYFDNTATNWFKNDNDAAISGTTTIFCYPKTAKGLNAGIQKYPGTQMTKVSGNLYKYQVPTNTKYVKFNEGHVNCLGHDANACGGLCGRTMPQTVIPDGPADLPKNRENGGYELVGAMICRNLKWEDYGDYPLATLSTSDVTFSGEPEPTEKPTDPPTPTEPSSNLILGDADLSGKVDVNDATTVQKCVAKMLTLSSDAKLCADVDEKGIDVLDATLIQKWVAKMDVPYDIGKPIKTTPTETQVEPTDEPEPPQGDTVVTLNSPDCFKGAEGIYLYAYNDFGGENAAWPGVEMTKSGSTYKCTVTDSELNRMTFVGYYGDVTDPADQIVKPNCVQSGDFSVTNTPISLETITIKATQNWSNCNIHFWSTGDACTVWPGIAMSGSSGNWSYKLPANSPYTKYKLNSGLGGNESPEYDVPGGGVDPTDNPPIGDDTAYLDATNADVANPVWFAWIWRDGSDGTAVKMTNCGNHEYSVQMNNCNNVIFVRMPEGSTQLDWNSKWNQTGNLIFNSSTPLFVMNSDCATGSWTTK